MKLQLKVIPNSSQDKIVGWLDWQLKIKVRAQPEKGKANVAVIKVLSEATGIDSQDIKIVSGQGSTNKQLEIISLSESGVLGRIGKFLVGKGV